MTRILLLVSCLVALAYAGKNKYHVAHTDPVDKSQPVMTFDELRELVSKESHDEIGGEEIQDDKAVVLVSPQQNLRLFLRNPSNETEEVRFLDILPYNSLVMKFCVRNRGFYSSEEKETFSDVEKHFLDVDNPEKRSKIILGKIHRDTDEDNIRWLDDDESEKLEEYLDEDWRDVVPQRLGMLIQMAPGDVFSIHIGFREVIPPSIDATKDLYQTHMTVHIGQKANGIEGLMESPNYPFNYPNNADIKWVIRVPPNRDFGVNIVITELSTESCCDRIYMYDGLDTNAAVIGVVSGNLTNQTTDNYTSSGADVLVEFRSDCLISQGYFSFYFTTIKFPLVPACSGGELLDGVDGYITSSNYPIDYPEIAHCTWLIATPTETTVDLEIIDFNLDQRDTVRVYDVFENGAVPLADLTGNQEPYTHIPGQSDRMYLVFESANHLIPRRGFNFHFTAVPVPKACDNGLTIDEDAGELTSLNYPQNYEVNLDCTWQIRVNVDDVIFIDVVDFNTEEYYDILYIYDGPDTTYKMIAGLSGDKGLERGYLTTSNIAFLEFVSDYSVTDGGFRVTWKAYTTSTQCNSDDVIMVEGDVGVITTPNYPMPFPSSIHCHWTIVTDIATIVQLHISDVDIGLEPDHYLLTIYDGPSMSSRVLFNGTRLPRFQALDINATQNEVHIMLHGTSDNPEERGVFIEWSQYNLADVCSQTTQLLGPQGPFDSPLYPGYYPSGYTCSYFIQTPIRTKVALLRKEFQLGPRDTLTAYDGDSPKSDLLFQCSRDTCDLKPATRNGMYLVFTTHSSNQGFSFNYYGSSNSCVASKHLHEELTQGFITSIGFPSNYGDQSSCEWSIIGFPREIIEITVDLMYTEACCDFLTVYDGNSTASPEILRISGTHYDETVDTSDNRAFITFSTDVSVTYPGFTLFYTGFVPKDDYDYSGSGSGSGDDLYTCSGYDEVVKGRNDTQGYLVAPGYVNNYPNDLDYCWYLSFPAIFEVIELFFYRVEIEQYFDVILIYIGQSVNPDQLFADLTGTLAYIQYRVPSNSVTILFHTDESVTKKGFVLEYNAIL